MRYFQDIGILTLYSFLALFFIEPGSDFIFALLCTMILMCCCYVFENRILISILFLIYGLITLQLTELLLFYPIFIYVILHQYMCPFLLWATGIYSYIFAAFCSDPQTFPAFTIYAGVFRCFTGNSSGTEYSKL